MEMVTDRHHAHDGGPACPSDPETAEGTACSVDGQACGACTDPCSFCNVLVCQDGLWTHVEAVPDPNCHDGGAHDGGPHDSGAHDGGVHDGGAHDGGHGDGGLDGGPAPDAGADADTDGGSVDGGENEDGGEPDADTDGGVDSGSLCPDDLQASIGSACAPEGLACGASNCQDACSFCNLIVCVGGTWEPREVFPDPSCGGG
jgi:hypothetical protein